MRFINFNGYQFVVTTSCIFWHGRTAISSSGNGRLNIGYYISAVVHRKNHSTGNPEVYKSENAKQHLFHWWYKVTIFLALETVYCDHLCTVKKEDYLT